MSRPARLVFAVAAVVSVGYGLFVLSAGHETQDLGNETVQDWLCGPSCVYRSAALVGVRTTREQVTALLPATSGGHSMLELAIALRSLGLDAEGRRIPVDKLSNRHVPCIVHLRNPDHFVVVLKVLRHELCICDNLGNRKDVARGTIAPRWSGYLLVIRKASSAAANRLRDSKTADVPKVVFDTLHVDKEQLEPNASNVEYRFRFQNRGQRPLTIDRVTVSCHCLSVTKPDKPIGPGERGSISLRYTPKQGSRQTSFSQQAVVSTNDPANPELVLFATGTILRGAEFSPMHVYVGDVMVGSPLRVRVLATGLSDASVMESVTCSLEKSRAKCQWNSRESVRQLAPDCPTCERVDYLAFDIRVVPHAPVVGPFSETLTLRGHWRGGTEVTIPMAGRFVAPVMLDSSLLEFGEVADDDVAIRELRIVAPAGARYDVCEVVPRASPIVWRLLKGNDGRPRAIEFTGIGADLVKLSGQSMTVKVRTESPNAEFALPVTLYAWKPAARRR